MTTKVLIVAVLGAGLSLASFSGFGGDVESAAMSRATAVSESNRAATKWQVDAVHSNVLFRLRHAGVSNFWGRFNAIAGTVNWDDADLSACGIELEIDAKSVDTNDAKRNEHVRGADFFDAQAHPKIKFKSTALKKDGNEFLVTGDLTFHGVTKSVTAKARKVGEGESRMGRRAGFDAEFKINRSDFGVKTYPDEVLGHQIELWVALEVVVAQ